MANTLRILGSMLIVTCVLMLSACAPEVGSPEWCKSIEEKPKGDLTVNEAKDYAKHCVFK